MKWAMPTDPLSRGNTPVFCKLCFTAWQQWKFIKSHELCSVTWESRCLQGFAKGRKLPWNSSEFLSVGIKCGNQDKCGIERAYKEFIKKDSVWETECCKKTKDQRVHFIGTEFELQGPKLKKAEKLNGQMNSKNTGYNFFQFHLSPPQKYIK